MVGQIWSLHCCTLADLEKLEKVSIRTCTLAQKLSALCYSLFQVIFGLCEVLDFKLYDSISNVRTLDWYGYNAHQGMSAAQTPICVQQQQHDDRLSPDSFQQT